MTASTRGESLKFVAHLPVVWSRHALAKAKEHVRPWTSFRSLVDRKIQEERWDVWWELEPREREMRRNLVIGDDCPTGQTYAVIRLADDDVYLVLTVLTTQQHAFSTTHCWHRTSQRVLDQLETADRARAVGLSPPAAALTHSPFASLRRFR